MTNPARSPALRPGCGCPLPVVLFVVVGNIGGLAVAPSGGGHANGSAFRTALYNGLTQRFGSAVGTVDCPDDLPTQEGSTFDCVVRFGAEPLTMHVRVANQGGKPVAQFSTDQTVVDVPATANSIRDDVAHRTGSQNVAVDCGANSGEA